MHLFLHHAYIRISSQEKAPFYADHRRLQPEDLDKPACLHGKCLLMNAEAFDLARILHWSAQEKIPELEELICLSADVEKLKSFVKKEFRVVKAAGGLVQKNGKFLLIHRLGKWDLPKGKLEKGEKMKEAAIREVEEECSIKAERRNKICNTWHSYNLDGKKILKKTAWYAMNCLDDRKMKPQKEEGIDQICWLSREDAESNLITSYRSIQFVLNKYVKGFT